jgi:sodium/bile acid cotransporter 7
MRAAFFPIGLLIAIGLAMAFPLPGTIIAEWQWGAISPIHILIGIIFLISGWKFDSLEKNQWRQWVRPFFGAMTIHYLIWPLLVPLTVFILTLSGAQNPGLVFGLMIMASVPTTISSAVVISEQGGGDRWLALFLTMSLSSVGVLLTPLLLNLLSPEIDGSIAPGRVFLTLLCTVVIPFAIGFKLKTFPLFGALQKSPPVLIILAVWLLASRHQPEMVSTTLTSLASLVAVSVAAHILMLAVSWWMGGMVTTDRAQRISFAIIGGQKTLPFALSIIASASDLRIAGLAITFCVIFHFSQITIDSFWAGKMRKIDESAG